MKKNNLQFGFTLIEVTVSVAIFALLVVGIVALVSNILSSSNKQSSLLSDQDQARRVAFQLISELRNASTASDGSYSINQAGDQQLIFFTTLNNSNGTVSRIRYFVQNGALYKGVLAPTGTPPVYNTSNEKVSLVLNDLGNGSSPVFYYYDGTYAGTGDIYLPQPVNLNSVKYIKIRLIIKNLAGVSNTNTYTITAGAAIRNLKTNLGD